MSETDPLRFAEPAWFWGLLLLPFLAGLIVAAELHSKKMIARMVAPRLRAQLAAGVSYGKRRFRAALLLLAYTALIFTMARPQWGYEWQEAKLKGRDVLIAVDVSKSMLANDLAPNRLTRARLATQDLIGLLEGDRLGLIAFAGSAFLQAPLTIDYGAVLTASQELDTDLIPRGGTNIAAALETAIEAFGKGEGSERALVLFTDGEELDANGVKAAEKAKEAGIKVFTVGVGSTEGSVIPIEGTRGGTEFLKDRGNKIVKTKLDEARLQEISQITGGFYSRLEGLGTMENIVTEGIKSLEETESDSKMSKKPIDRYQWPLAIGIGLLMVSTMIGERRRLPAPRPAPPVKRPSAAALTALVALSVFLSHLDSAEAAMEEAVPLYNSGKYQEALQEFEKLASKGTPPAELDYNLGAAAYKAKEYDKAMAAFSKALLSENAALRERATYNLGNTLFQKGAAKEKPEEKITEWKESLKKFEETLATNPKNENAKFNRDTVAKLIEELEKQQEQEKKQEEQKQEQEKKEEKKEEQEKKDQKKDSKDQKSGDKEDKKEQGKQDQQEKSSKEQKNEDSQENGDQQKQQGDEGQEKDDQSKGSEGDKNEGKSGEPKEKDQGGEGGEEKEQKSENSEQAKQDQKDQQGGGGKEQESKQQTAGNDSDKQEKKEPGEVPEVGEQPREGDLKSAKKDSSGEGKEEGQTAQASAAGDDSEKSEGTGYTKMEARRLLESMESEEDRVMLFDKKRRDPVFNDW